MDDSVVVVSSSLVVVVSSSLDEVVVDLTEDDVVAGRLVDVVAGRVVVVVGLVVVGRTDIVVVVDDTVVDEAGAVVSVVAVGWIPAVADAGAHKTVATPLQSRAATTTHRFMRSSYGISPAPAGRPSKCPM